jgi:hypothetical protein
MHDRMEPITLASEKLVSGRKIIFLDMRENHRGKFLTITEDCGGHRDRVIIPAEALGDLVRGITVVMRAAGLPD